MEELDWESGLASEYLNAAALLLVVQVELRLLAVRGTQRQITEKCPKNCTTRMKKRAT